MGTKTIDGQIEQGSIIIDADFDEIRSDILEGEVVVVKDVYTPDELKELRQTAFEFGQETEPISNPKDRSKSSFHSIDINPEDSQHRKVYHSFNFVLADTADDTDVDQTVRPYFEQLRDFQNRVAETDGDFGDLSGLAMRPIMIHYPQGGGNFPMHTHPFLPQKVGLIVSLSEYGEDYQVGGTRFAHPSGDVVDLEGHHTIGDIALFRIDLPHHVVACDPEETLDFDSQLGRWSMILPYNRY